MGLLSHQLIDIIEWPVQDADTLVWKFPRYENEIKMGAKLIVREAQQAVFINEGKIADVFQPGTYTLQTQNLPILATLKGWKYGFESPYKADVVFRQHASGYRSEMGHAKRHHYIRRSFWLNRNARIRHLRF